MTDGVPSPREIWDGSLDEGERRLKRRFPGQATTGLLGGFDVMIGLIVVVALTGAVSTVTNDELAHAIGALPFGIAFVFLSIGRSELFTENFLVPVAGYLAQRGTGRELARLWGVALVFNVIGVSLLALIVSGGGVLTEPAYEAAGDLGNTFLERSYWGAFASAIVAGVAITLYSWLTMAVPFGVARIMIAMLIGYVLLLPVLNHAVVSMGELVLALFAGTAETTVGEALPRIGIALAGNTIGGIGFITLTRLVQVSGETRDAAHAVHVAEDEAREQDGQDPGRDGGGPERERRVRQRI